MNIFLIGFMGSGKTYWGRIWAEANGYAFIDLDEVIETAAGRTIAAIFDKNEEVYFRELEAEKLRSLDLQKDTIIACGGGTPCFHNNMEWMDTQGTTVYLKSSSSQVLERVKAEKAKRPLLKKVNPAELLFFIEQKLKEREPFYLQAKIIIHVDKLTTESFAQKILSNSTL